MQRSTRGRVAGRNSSIRRGQNAIMLALALSPLAMARQAGATNKYYVGGASNYWSTTASWSLTSGGSSGAAVPVSGDAVFITNSTGSTQTLNYNVPGTAVTLAGLTIDATGGSGTGNDILTMSANTLNSNAAEYVGASGNGTVNQTGGTANFSGGSSLYLGYYQGSTGNYTLGTSGGSGSLTVSGSEFIGYSGTGNFTQNSGTNLLSSGSMLYLGANGSTGSYTLNSGTLSATGSDSNGVAEYIGFYQSDSSNITSSTFKQTGGTNTLTGNLVVGESQYSSGTYTLTNTTSTPTLTVNGSELIGDYAYGTSTTYGGSFIQTAGTHTVTQSLLIGENSSGYGNFNLSGGNLQEGNSSATAFAYGEIIGDSGYGELDQGGGTNTVGTAASGQELIIGNYGTGIYYLYNGGTTLTVNGAELIGVTNGSSGSFNQGNTNGNHTVTGFLSIGDQAGSTGTYTLTAGNLIVGTSSTVTGLEGYGNDEIVGSAGTGYFTQTGGINTVGSATVSQMLLIGASSSGMGSYTMSGTGSILKVYGTEIVGDFATGNTNQSGGTFTQTAGTHTVTGQLYVGSGSGSTGQFSLDGGTLTAAQEIIGQGGGGTGTVYQDGGSNTIPANGSSPSLVLGNAVEDIGAYTIIGAAATLTVPYAYVGGNANASGGTGTLDIAAGTVIFSQGLKVWNTPGSSVNFSGGSLTVGSLSTSGNPSEFIWTGGTLTINSAVSVDSNFALGSSITLNNLMTLVTTGTLTDNGQITLAGGTLNSSGPVVNNNLLSGYGTIISTGTITTGTFTNNSEIAQGAGNLILSASGTVTNAGNMDLALGRSLALGSSPFTNSGSINVNGATVNGTGWFTNTITGTINGPGMISTTRFSNAGLMTVSTGSLNVSSAWTNTGVVELAGITSTLAGGLITNSATIQGFGNLTSSINNGAGTIEASGGTLLVTGALTNPAGGLLAVDTGSKLLVLGGLATNAGLISLTGGTYDNGGAAMTNTGQITGYGTLRTGGLTNAGHFTLSGTSTAATTTVNGNVTNNAGQLITIQTQPAIFTGNIVNNGTISTIGTTVTFAGSYTGNAYISDPSTNVFQSNVTIVSGGSMTGGASDIYRFFSGAVTNNGSFSNAGQLTSTDNVTSSGTFNQSGSQSWSAGTVFTNTAGTASFGSDAGAGGQNLAVNVSGGSVSFSSSQHLASLSIAAGTTATITGSGSGHRSVFFTPSVSVAGTLDLTGNDLDVQTGGSAAVAAISAMIKQGYNNGAWSGTGITSSSAANDTTHLTAVGVILNTASGSTPIYTSFDGATVAVNDVLVKDTYYGDTNLDGKVDGSDYSRIDSGYLSHATGWINGDFNYDGVVNGSDYTLIDNAFNTQGAQLDASIASPNAVATAQVAGSPATTSVPEPAGLLALAALWPLGRRRRNRGNRGLVPKP